MASKETIHEVVNVSEELGFSLNATLQQMLNEHYSHRTQRRGCGYTQSTRYLSDYINRPRSHDTFGDLRLFRDWRGLELKTIQANLALRGIELPSWRHLDQRPELLEIEEVRENANLSAMIQTEMDRQKKLRKLPHLLSLEESKILANMIVDIVLPVDPKREGLTVLPCWQEKLKIGTCPMAEKFFLELAHEYVARRGIMNVFLDSEGEPIMVEKMNLGDSHSCISFVPLVMNGVRLPAGTLFGAQYEEGVTLERRCKEIAGSCIDFRSCTGFRYLRLTTLVVAPENRRRTFSSHFDAQRAEGLFAPDTTKVSQLLTVARKQL